MHHVLKTLKFLFVSPLLSDVMLQKRTRKSADFPDYDF